MLLTSTSKKTLSSVFFIAYLFLSHSPQAFESQSCGHKSSTELSTLYSGKVEWQPDGDTVHLISGEKIRLLNIDTPEMNPKSNKPTEPFAKAATDYLKNLIGKNKTIYWHLDKKKKDRYGRILAHVYNQKGKLLSAKLVEQGLAQVLVIPPNDQYWHCLKQLEATAIDKEIGLWKKAIGKIRTPKMAIANQDFQWITGKISEIRNTKTNRWIILDDTLWVGIPNDQLNLFDTNFKLKSVGDEFSVRGYVYHSHGKLRIKLKHPAMLMPLFQ